MQEITPEIFTVITHILVETNLILASVLYIRWLKPFVLKKHAAFFAALSFWGICMMDGLLDAGWIAALFLWFLKIALPILVVFLLDHRRNLAQKIFLCVIFLLIQWLSLETFMEIEAFGRDFIFGFDLFRSNLTAIVAQFIVQSLIYYGGSLALLYFSIRILQRVYKRKYENLTFRELIMLLTPAVTILMVRPIIAEYYYLSGDRNAVSDYIGEWKSHFRELSPHIKTGNAITDVVLSEYLVRFEEHEIQFESHFFYPEGLSINAFDLCVILTNALQNAFEASENVSKPWISVTSAIHGNVFILNVKNGTALKARVDEESGIPYSMKRGEGHGYGLKNIRSIAQKYKGEIEVRQEKTDQGLTFILNVMLVLVE